MTEVNVALEIVCIIVSFLLLLHCLLEREKKDKAAGIQIGLLVVNILVLASDIFAWEFDGRKEYTIHLYSFNTMIYIMGYMMIALYTYYMVIHISQKAEVSVWITRCVTALSLIASLLVIVSLFNHMYFYIVDGVYYRGNLYLLSQILPFFLLFLDLIISFRHRKSLGLRNTLVLMSYCLFPLIAIIVQVCFYGVALLYVASTLSLLIVYLAVHLEYTKRMKEQAIELDKMNVDMMLSQIQPHFLYNSLTAIQSLCDKQPLEAQRVLGEFTKFLKMNMNSLTCKTLIPFKSELEHVNHYLDLEKLRLGDKLRIEYDIQEQDFNLPALCIQPVIENAVKYGIEEKKEGGTIYLKVHRESHWIVIEIRDDGVGFNTDELYNLDRKKDNELHIGLKNVKERVKRLANGEVNIESTIGTGTVVTIRLRS